MSVVVLPDVGRIDIPNHVSDVNTFREWVHSGSLPEKVKVHFINGEIWVDGCMEELNSHNRIKTALSVALTPLVEPDLGYYVSDGMRLTIPDLDLSTEPDGMVVSHASLRRGRLITASGTGAEATELIGIPDLVIEIVSPSSEEKDTDWLMESYFRAGIPEFWLIDARAKDLRFDLYRPASKGYSAIRKSAGFSKSTVLGKSVRLTRSRSSTGIATYVLNVR